MGIMDLYEQASMAQLDSRMESVAEETSRTVTEKSEIDDPDEIVADKEGLLVSAMTIAVESTLPEKERNSNLVILQVEHVEDERPEDVTAPAEERDAKIDGETAGEPTSPFEQRDASSVTKQAAEDLAPSVLGK